MFKEIFITEESGMLVAEIDGVKAYELHDVIRECGFGFGEWFEIFVQEGDDIWTIADMISDLYANYGDR